MREAYRWALHGRRTSGDLVAGFFFNRKGHSLEHSKEGSLSSLLHQLLTQDRTFLANVARRPDDHDWGVWPGRDAETPWTLEELESELRGVLLNQTHRRKIFIFVDALDECAADGMRSVLYFWRSTTRAAAKLGTHLHVLMSSRHFPGIFLEGCPELHVDHNNRKDIGMYLDERFQLSFSFVENEKNDHNRKDTTKYVKEQFQLSNSSTEKKHRWLDLRNKILDMSGGIFLWAVVAAEQAIETYEQGSGMQVLTMQLGSLSVELRALFSQIFSFVKPMDKALTIRLFQWAV
jgi:hypothetical protein